MNKKYIKMPRLSALTIVGYPTADQSRDETCLECAAIK